ncbi:disulfide oxidoreductase [Thalassobacillus hwangdonensis]|uniref:Probable disulfide formation protein n=1 Tax=Thalassobacillus hwangdonensis TaxID=546108 RepID=A0ABW3KXB2_9BACI
MEKRVDSSADNLMFIAWGQALIATLGSLFFSEVYHYVPCELCWYQRILMYPLVVIYGLTLWKKDLSIALPGLVLSGIGTLVSIYHYSLQKIPAWGEVGASCGTVPCNAEYVNYFGFITIPFLALTAFIVIFITHLIMIRKQRRQ